MVLSLDGEHFAQGRFYVNGKDFFVRMDWHLLTLGFVKDPVFQVILSPWARTALQSCFVLSIMNFGTERRVQLTSYFSCPQGLCRSLFGMSLAELNSGEGREENWYPVNQFAIEMFPSVLQQKVTLFHRIKEQLLIKSHKDALVVSKTEFQMQCFEWQRAPKMVC